MEEFIGKVASYVFVVGILFLGVNACSLLSGANYTYDGHGREVYSSREW